MQLIRKSYNKATAILFALLACLALGGSTAMADPTIPGAAEMTAVVTSANTVFIAVSGVVLAVATFFILLAFVKRAKR